jgi:ankyrin repeat protein
MSFGKNPAIDPNKLIIELTKGQDIVKYYFLIEIAYSRLDEAVKYFKPEYIQDGLIVAIACETTLDVVEFCLQNGANPNYEFKFTFDSYTPIIHAIQTNNAKLVGLLVLYGADVTMGSSYGDSPLCAACVRGPLDVVQFLVENGAKLNSKCAPLVRAAQGPLYKQIVPFLLEKGAHINQKNEGNNTALMSACYIGHLDMAKFLISKGADMNVKNETGDTALMLACKREHVDIMRLLLKNGAKVNVQNAFGVTPLIWAVRLENIEMIKLLLNEGANPEIADENGHTAISIALGSNKAVMKVLGLGQFVSVEPSDESCAICLNALNEPDASGVSGDIDPVKLRNCGHAFHLSCIEHWGSTGGRRQRGSKISCPLCRTLSFGKKSLKKSMRKSRKSTKKSRKSVKKSRKSMKKSRKSLRNSFGRFSKKRSYLYYYMLMYLPESFLCKQLGLDKAELKYIKSHLQKVYHYKHYDDIDIPEFVRNTSSGYYNPRSPQNSRNYDESHMSEFMIA